ncbi:MAG: DUF190 domain-containing protein [Rhodomicrobium sp.]
MRHDRSRGLLKRPARPVNWKNIPSLVLPDGPHYNDVTLAATTRDDSSVTGNLRRTARYEFVAVEILDAEEKVNAFLEVLDQLLTGGAVTIERFECFVIRVSGRQAEPIPRDEL